MNPTPEHIRADLEGAAKVEPIEPAPVRFYLFLSYDLVNSTIFKQTDPDWPKKLSEFYRLAERGVIARIPGVVVWKYAGDEVLFWCTASAVADVSRCVESGYEVLTDLDGKM